MNPIADASFRRFIVVISGLLTATLNKRLGLDISESTVSELLIFLGTYIVASNTKAAVEAKANAAGSAAAATVTPENAPTIIKDAAKPEAQP